MFSLASQLKEKKVDLIFFSGLVFLPQIFKVRQYLHTQHLEIGAEANYKLRTATLVTLKRHYKYHSTVFSVFKMVAPWRSDVTLTQGPNGLIQKTVQA